MGRLVEGLDRLLAATHPRALPEGFREVVRGRRSLEERVRPWMEALRRL